MTILLALFFQSEFSVSTALVAGVVAAVGGYGANRFFLGALSTEVKNLKADHGRRLDALEEDSKKCERERGIIRGLMNSDGGI